jgi:undecaprenyl-diphosphatase
MDVELLHWLNQTIAHPALDVAALALSIVGLALLPGIGVALLFGPRRSVGAYRPVGAYQSVGAAILVALAGGLAMVLLFQYLGQRPRPSAVRLIWATPSFPSFPSGHAAAAFSTAVVLGLSFRRWPVWLLVGAGACLIALSRVYLGHHYPTDILAGAVVGSAVGVTSYGLLVRRDETVSPWSWLLWPQIAIAFLATQMAYLSILPLHLLTWPYADKVIHFLFFGLIAFWMNLRLKNRLIRLGNCSVPVTLLFLGTIVFLEEGSQAFSPLRSLDPFDLLSNLAGLIVFWWLSKHLLIRELAVSR